MLRELFLRDHERYQRSRCGVELEAFACWLVEQGHLRHPLRLHLRRARAVLNRCKQFKPGGMFRETDVRRAFIVSGPETYLYSCTGRIFIRFLAATSRLIPVERNDPLSLFIRGYHRYLADVRGFSRTTLGHHCAAVTDFLSRGLPRHRKLSTLTAADVEAYIQIKSKENTRQSLQHVVAHLRAFLRYCGDRGEAPSGLDVIDTPRVYRGEQPPRALDWSVVQRLLGSIRRRSPRDWRDYVILHLMAHYALRPSEVAALRLDSIDWHAGTLKVEQRKTRSTLVLPLSSTTLDLLHRYLHRGRPDCDLPALFLRIRSPIKALKNYGIIEVFYYRVRRSGLRLDGASSYSLRHTFAMRLLSRGVGVKAIGDVLGHRSLEATCVYLRLDIDMLRTVGLPIPRLSTFRRAGHD
jgi:integrase/recombinase XerD